MTFEKKKESEEKKISFREQLKISNLHHTRRKNCHQRLNYYTHCVPHDICTRFKFYAKLKHFTVINNLLIAKASFCGDVHLEINKFKAAYSVMNHVTFN